MSTPVITPPPADLSMSDIRAMVAKTVSPVETKPTTSDPVEPKAKPEEPATNTETAPEPVEKQLESEESAEEPLPENVQKRIAKEAAKAASIQAAIDRAVSDRKAKEQELTKLKTDASGSEPAKETPQASAEKPKRPVFGEKGHEAENWDQFEARQAEHEGKLSEWTKKQAIEEFKATQAKETAETKRKERWDAAVTKHGKDFPALMDTACASAPEGLQLAISALDGWSDVAVHLAKDPAKLQSLVAEYNANPYKAIATLGRIEAALTPKESTTTNTAVTKPLPEPLAKLGGNASASGMSLQDTLEKGSWAQVKAIANKARAK